VFLPGIFCEWHTISFPCHQFAWFSNAGEILTDRVLPSGDFKIQKYKAAEQKGISRSDSLFLCMPEITYKALLGSLKKQDFSPIYLLHGDEAFLLDQAEAAIKQNALDAATRDFNFTMLYGKDADLKQVLENCYRYPVMAPKQVVVLREAQTFKDLSGLEQYAAKPVESTILVLVHKHKKLDGRLKLSGLLKEKASILTSMKFRDNDVVPWIKNYLKEEGIGIDPDAAELIFTSMGNDLSALMNSIDKLILNVQDTKHVSRNDVHQFVGIHRSYNVFELGKALGSRDTFKVFEIVKYFESNPKAHPLVVTIGFLNTFFSKLLIAAQHANKPKNDFAKAIGVSPYYVGEYYTAIKHFQASQIERAISLIKKYDLKSKGFYGGAAEDQLKEMLIKIMQ